MLEAKRTRHWDAAHADAPNDMTEDTTAPELSIVVPAYNEERCIAACIRSLAGQETDCPYEVILVDNNSTDNTAAVALSAAGRLNLRIVHERRQGRGPARRTGFALAHGKVVLSADADTTYPPNWLSSLLGALADPEVVAVTGTARIDDLSGWQNVVFNICQPLAMWCYRLALGHHCLSGFNFAIRRNVYRASGGFDPALNAEEDADLSRRVARLGKIRFLLIPVTFSGRRFKRGLLRGLLAYTVLFWHYHQQRTSAHLSDVR
jgi:cellulose synthase/poly-beta-1,6-N-acetylglucosamine synthase-like glycosyltransferase